MNVPHHTLSHFATILEAGFYERRLAIELLIVSSIACESVFLFGPPGTAKSLLARNLKNLFHDAHYFEHLLGKFSLPEDLFGPISIKDLTEKDEYNRNFDGFLPSAEIVFLDEVWKASPVIQNFILSAINERIFHNGNKVTEIPLRVLLTASNEVPESFEQEAFWDRLLVRIPISPLTTIDNFRHMIEVLPKPAFASIQELGLRDWAELSANASQMPFEPGIADFLFKIRESIFKQFGKRPSDRRLLKIFGLAKTHAYLVGRKKLRIADFCIGIFCLWNRVEEIESIKKIFETEIARFLLDSGTIKQTIEHLSKTQQKTTSDLLLFDDEYLELESADFVELGQTVRLWKDDFDHAGDRVDQYELFIYEAGLFIKTFVIRAKIDKSRAHFEFDGKSYNFKKSGPRVTESQGESPSRPSSEVYADLIRFRGELEEEFKSSTITRYVDFMSIIKPIDKKLLELGVSFDLK